MDVQKMTREYHAKYHPTHGRMTPSTVTPELLAFRQTAFMEEVAEVTEAWYQCDPRAGGPTVSDIAHLLHELADVVYVAYGTAERCGVDLDDVINAVHRANMRKVPNPAGGKATKPAGWVPASDVVAALVQRADRPADPFAFPAEPVPRDVKLYGDRVGPVFTAQFPGECAECGDDVEGEPCRMVEGGITHDVCFEEWDATDGGHTSFADGEPS